MLILEDSIKFMCYVSIIIDLLGRVIFKAANYSSLSSLSKEITLRRQYLFFKFC